MTGAALGAAGQAGGGVRAVARAGLTAALGAALLAQAASVGPLEHEPPYPWSDLITEMVLDWSTFGRGAFGSDNWPTTWAADGNVYTTWGDGGGFGQDAVDRAYVSIGIARLTGDTIPTLWGQNLIGGFEPLIAPCFKDLAGPDDRRRFANRTVPCRTEGLHAKSWSILALDGDLHLFVTPGELDDHLDEARLYKAPIGTNDWTRADWAFGPGDNPRLLAPALVQAGRNNAASAFVHAYATRFAPRGGFALHRGPAGGEIHLLRAAKGADLMRRSSWEFYAARPGEAPAWSGRQADSRPVFVDPAGVGFAPSGIFAEHLGRWLLIAEHGRSFAGRLGVYEAPDPWGPWRTVFHGTLASEEREVPPTAFYANFLANSLDEDGNFTLLFTGTRDNDALDAIEGWFELAPE